MVFQREKIISGNTSAMVEEIEPISLPLRWSNCDAFLEGEAANSRPTGEDI